MSIFFDIRCNLQAKPFIELSLSETEQFFVKPFDNTSKRHVLFEEYKRYTHDLRMLLDHPFYQWMDGSFISTKHDLIDIDLVSFLDNATYSEKEITIDECFSK